jgi:hypothetical protein
MRGPGWRMVDAGRMQDGRRIFHSLCLFALQFQSGQWRRPDAHRKSKWRLRSPNFLQVDHWFSRARNCHISQPTLALQPMASRKRWREAGNRQLHLARETTARLRQHRCHAIHLLVRESRTSGSSTDTSLESLAITSTA